MKASFTSIEEISFEYFLEFTVNDKVGVLESVSHLFSQHSISIKSMLQDNKKQICAFDNSNSFSKGKRCISYFDVVRKERICN